jgi:hypothetical protein
MVDIMSDYMCDVCKKPFKRKANLTYHINRAVCSEKPYKCKFCPNKFTSKTAMYTHIRDVCKIKKEEEKKQKDFNERLKKIEEENKTLKKQADMNEKKTQKEIKKLKAQIKTQSAISKTKNINNGSVVNNNNNNNIINNIAFIGYGKEDMEKIDKKEILKAIQNGFKSVVNLTEAMHFNPNHPEYQNIYISNIKDKYAMMYNGKEWDLSMKDELVDRIYDDKKNYIEENLNEFAGSLTVSRKNALDRWLNTDDEDVKISKIKNDIKLLLYNKRNVVIDTHNNIIDKKSDNNKLIKSTKNISKTKRTIKDV